AQEQKKTYVGFFFFRHDDVCKRIREASYSTALGANQGLSGRQVSLMDWLNPYLPVECAT
ncbi:MAG: hypothetical protein EBX37_15655, partial [Alphaproteobacteria bacterium]|nr:hypothetical protein [Alphaproteobacteria bacterium]